MRKYLFIPFYVMQFAAIELCAQSMMVTRTMNTNIGPVTIPQWIHMPTYYNGVGSGGGYPAAKYEFYVVLANDSVIRDRTFINYDSIDSTYFVEIKKRKETLVVKPNDTKELYRILPSGLKLPGVPADSCWLFRVGAGKINSYSYFAPDDFSYVMAIQKGSGPILPLTKENLADLVDHDPAYDRLFKRKKLKRIIETYNYKNKGN